MGEWPKIMIIFSLFFTLLDTTVAVWPVDLNGPGKLILLDIYTDNRIIKTNHMEVLDSVSGEGTTLHVQ
jgi:hypothetical protein